MDLLAQRRIFHPQRSRVVSAKGRICPEVRNRLLRLVADLQFVAKEPTRQTKKSRRFLVDQVRENRKAALVLGGNTGMGEYDISVAV